ncbi:hypothetical protein, partial [Fibrobacter sp. UWEL]|uniref:hypothetical protein n=1 Tax=Fibrobacter sp. UWEL TaxID=1896209 RepID=UPI00090F60EF
MMNTRNLLKHFFVAVLLLFVQGVFAELSEGIPEKVLYVMIPPDYEDWMSSVPMISMDGGKTGRALTADP